MRTSLSLSVAFLISAFAAGCIHADTDSAIDNDDLAATEQQATDPGFRVYNLVEAVLPAANYDGIAGDECLVLLNPEHRLRKVILVEAAGAGNACALSAYAGGNAVSFTWGDTAAYSNAAGITAIRAALSDSNGAVHRLVGVTTSEAAALANLQQFLTLTDAQQASELATFTAVRVHSIYDFEGAEQVKAETAYQAVRITQTCENPGAPRLDAHVNGGFVYGYIASNSGSCHSGWFSKRHTYNRSWRLVARFDYSE
jgi:hypothetical protein